jgi:hypothetical protein
VFPLGWDFKRASPFGTAFRTSRGAAPRQQKAAYELLCKQIVRGKCFLFAPPEVQRHVGQHLPTTAGSVFYRWLGGFMGRPAFVCLK